MHEIVDAVERTGAKRLVIDSLAGFEMALAPGFRTDFRESLYRMIGALTRTGVTIVSTVEVIESFTALALSPYSISFLSDDIIRLRYVEIDGQLRKVLMVVKMRAATTARTSASTRSRPTGYGSASGRRAITASSPGFPSRSAPGSGATTRSPDATNRKA